MTPKERNAYLREIGICTHCGKRKAAEGRNSCPDCLDMFKVYYEQRKSKGLLYYQNCTEDYYSKKRERYAYLKEHGLCVVCGKKTSGKSRCDKCNRKHNEAQNARYHKKG